MECINNIFTVNFADRIIAESWIEIDTEEVYKAKETTSHRTRGTTESKKI